MLEKLNQSFPDPFKFEEEEKFLYAAKVASVFKKVIAELLVWVEGHNEKVKHYEKKMKGEIESFRIGG